MVETMERVVSLRVEREEERERVLKEEKRKRGERRWKIDWRVRKLFS